MANRDLGTLWLLLELPYATSWASMRSQIKLGRIGGILIGFHYSWFIIALLIMFSLAGHFRHVTPASGPIMVWTAAVMTGLLFFATLLLHELANGHSGGLLAS